MDRLKTCSNCRCTKDMYLDFYMCQGKVRSECKACTVKRNVRWAQANQVHLHRDIDPEKRRSYMYEYYHRNKSKFAEYRKRFALSHPGYHKEWARKKREENVDK